MNYEEIKKKLKLKQNTSPMVQISFKKRNTIRGVFIKSHDFEELSRKNFWRIVTDANLESYKVGRDENYARIFNGSEFTRLELLAEPEVA